MTSEPTLHAENDRPFPPPTINRWVRFQTVSTDALIAEMRYWTEYLELRQEQERHHV